MTDIMKKDKGIIIACDISYEHYHKLLLYTKIDQVSGYKIGFLGLCEGLRKVVEFTKNYFPDKIIIYDHQKAGTDIPHTANHFMRILKDSSIDAVILYPLAGKETQKAWVLSALDKDLGVIVGGLMTHSGFLRSEGGYIADEAIKEIYMNAVDLGVNNFILPASKNRIDQSKRLVDLIKKEVKNPMFYFVGIGAQGGELVDIKSMNLDRYHIIIGRDIHALKGKSDSEIKATMQNAILEYAANL